MDVDEGTAAQAAGVSVVDLRFEHLREPLGIGVARPRLTWRVATEIPGWQQAAYEVEAEGGRATGRVASDRSVLVPWPFAPLASRERVAVRVRVHGADGSASDWSAPRALEAGLFDVTDWSARFVAPPWDEDTSAPRPCPLLRREFDVGRSVARARLYVTALGVYEAQINGAIVGDHVLAPGWTSYHHRLRGRTLDVTAMGDESVSEPRPTQVGVRPVWSVRARWRWPLRSVT